MTEALRAGHAAREARPARRYRLKPVPLGVVQPGVDLAALALEHGASVCSTDRDFERFPGVERFDPL
ncbi:MAG: hypothetical protein KJ062_13365 [Thermoanaerobaculia bacterium]|nr:hypothetical protein [Thermoanaerobaculia bacterium]